MKKTSPISTRLPLQRIKLQLVFTLFFTLVFLLAPTLFADVLKKDLKPFEGYFQITTGSRTPDLCASSIRGVIFQDSDNVNWALGFTGTTLEFEQINQGEKMSKRAHFDLATETVLLGNHLEKVTSIVFEKSTLCSFVDTVERQSDSSLIISRTPLKENPERVCRRATNVHCRFTKVQELHDVHY